MKIAYFFIDDVIMSFHDIARRKLKSIFDNPYFKLLKENHDNYGLTVQLNLFYCTDDESFNLTEFPDTYKSEFEENSDWLKLAFHATKEHPNYPYADVTYETLKFEYERIVNEIKRFAGEKSLSNVVVPHWLPISKEGCRALADCGVKFLSCSVNDNIVEFTNDDKEVPITDEERERLSKDPEIKAYVRDIGCGLTTKSLCAYNHLDEETAAKLRGKNVSMHDPETGINFKLYSTGPCLNWHPLEKIKEALAQFEHKDYAGVANHEQAFYPEFYAHQPDMSEKITTMARTLHDFGFKFITCEDFK